jgi:hypothetical protein
MVHRDKDKLGQELSSEGDPARFHFMGQPIEQVSRQNLRNVAQNHQLLPSYRYLRHYGYKFPKEDHLALIHLLMSFITTPDLEPWLVNKTGSVLVHLLKRKELLPPNDLTIEWRPLYELYERLLYSPYEPHGMLQFPP